MKSLLLAGCLFILVFYSAYSQSYLGGGLAYGSDIDEVGLAVDGEFSIRDNFTVSPDVIIYLVDDGRDFKRGFWEFNTNLHYYFSGTGAAQVYAAAGLNLSTFTSKVTGFDRTSDTDLGLNLGLGSNFDINAGVKPYAEFKFTLGDFDQLVLLFGVKFPLN